MLTVALATPLAGCATDFRACESSEDCVLDWNTCGADAPYVNAVNREHRSEFQDSLCHGNCGICFVLNDHVVVPTCRANRCEVVHLPEAGLASCTADWECSSRTIECCTSRHTDYYYGHRAAYATEHEDELLALVCDGPPCGDPEPVPCIDGLCGGPSSAEP